LFLYKFLFLIQQTIIFISVFKLPFKAENVL